MAIQRAIAKGEAENNEDEERVEEEFRAAEEEARELDEREEYLVSLAEQVGTTLERRVKQQIAREQAEENAKRARWLQEMEEDVFTRNAIDFYEMFKNTCYITRDVGENARNDCTFKISNTPSHEPGEMLTHWSDGRFHLRPGNHAEYEVSVPAILFVQPGLEKRLPVNRQQMRVYPKLGGGANETDFGPVLTKLRGRGRRSREPITDQLRRRVREIKGHATPEEAARRAGEAAARNEIEVVRQDYINGTPRRAGRM